MGFLNAIKERSQRRNSAIRDAAVSPTTVESERVVMEWDKIYVEIDHDAGTVSDESRTQRRRNVDVPEEAPSVEPSVFEVSTVDSKSIALLKQVEGEMSHVAPSCSPTKSCPPIDSGSIDPTASNYDTRTFLSADSRTFLTRNPSSESESIRTGKNDVENPVDDNSRQVGKYLANNHFANAQLLRWKSASEEGPFLIQRAVVLSAIGVLFSTIYPLIIFDEYWTIQSLICAFHTTMLSFLIIVFEMRVCGARNPTSSRARLRRFLVRHLNVLRLAWGRGFLYMFAGSMNLTMEYYPCNYITGGILIALGLLSVLMGSHASYNLERMRLSLTDSSFLWSKFVNLDTDEDNLINIDDFSQLIWSLGLELDDEYTYRAFLEIDRDRDGLINFNEFKFWWIASQDDDGTIFSMDMSKVSKLTMDMSRASKSKKVPKSIRTKNSK